MASLAIELGQHAVIEASAGTGKTYTIETLVLRMLVEAQTPLERILLVTFTEKATADLRLRLRRALERKLRDHPEHAAMLQPALDHFDQAPIFTIHGFCQRLLQEYALEQGQDFRAALVSDAELLGAALRAVQRKLWRAHFGDRLRPVLDHAAFARDAVKKWTDRVLEVAGKYQPRSDHQLRPTPVPDWWQRLDEPDARWPGQLDVFTIAAIRQHLVDYKRQRGLQSFDDMIGTVEESFDAARNVDAPHLLNRLRERYRFGIVDEFQDTDPLQWRIFRRIFLEAGTSRLFVVGDPKQAIFGFRGADLPTYLHATRAMQDDFAARSCPLTTNWRSAPELLEALNCLFLDGEWFPKDSGIVYHEVQPPDEPERQTRVVTDLTNRAALTIVDLRAWELLTAARKQYGQFVAREIQRLLHGSGGQPALVYAHKDPEPRPLQASDVCILVFKRSEVPPIIAALDELGIPYNFQKSTGFWDSDEVRQLETLLVCLSRPEERSSFRKALLTWFFRVPAADLARSQDLPISHPARRLYQQWLAYTESRQWSALFQSMLEETGLLLLALDDAAAGLRLASLRHVMGTLERVGHGENRDLLGLIDWIRAKRQERDGANAEQPPPETQRARVRIMTIHGSKGLEFPIVFLAGGFTRSPKGNGVATYRDDAGRKVFDLCPDGEALERTKADAFDEMRRLLYVALTRAMFKLYVPKVALTSKTRGHAGPAVTVLFPALQQACPDKLGPLVAEIVAPLRLPDFGGPDSRPGDTAPLDPRPALAYAGPLFPSFEPSLDRRRIVVRSFSSMNRQHVAQVGEGPSYGDRVAVPHDEAAGAAEKDDPLRGPVFGDIVHNILETIDFTEVGHCTQAADLLLEGSPSRLLIEQAVRAQAANLRGKAREELEEAARQQIAPLIWSALHTPLAGAGGPLWQVPSADRIHELAFHCPEQPGAPVPANVRWEESFLTGKLDIVFRRRDRYFLLDWKTNLLPGYGPEHLQRCMDEADYHRQYRLYLHALARWLARVHGPSFDFLRDCGGVYYLFVRGLNGQDESAGVYFHRPTPADLDLAQIMAR